MNRWGVRLSTQEYKQSSGSSQLSEKIDKLHGVGGALLAMYQAPLHWRVDNTIHRINLYLVDSTILFVNTYLLDTNLSVGIHPLNSWAQLLI